MVRQTKYHSINRDYFLQTVQGFKKPFTAKELSDALNSDSTTLSTSTIYRLLDEFVADGILHKIYNENNIAKYYFFEHCENENHFYLECSKCHNIFHIDCKHLRNFTKHISKKHGFEISDYHLIISGLCADCQGKHA